MPRDICLASHACPCTLTHAAFPTTWHRYPDSLQHTFTPSATHARTHSHTPPPPTTARTPELEMLQSLPAAALPTTTPPHPLQGWVFPAGAPLPLLQALEIGV